LNSDKETFKIYLNHQLAKLFSFCYEFFKHVCEKSFLSIE